MPMISVIIPVYKAEKYIEDCVQSVLAQTHQDFELILVDDGSPDRSGEICDVLAQKDDRITVIHKENGGAATARNTGLDEARGVYIAFIDGDDLIHPQYLQFLLDLLQENKADFSMCHYSFFEGVKAECSASKTDIPRICTMLNGGELLADFHSHCRRVSLISLCMKLFKKEIFDNLRIPEGFIEEDSMSLPLILEKAQRIAKSEEKLYYWRVTPGSVTRSGFSEKSFAYIEVSRFQAEFFSKRKSKEAGYFQKEFLRRTLYYYYKVCDEKPELMESFRFYVKQYRRLFPKYFLGKEMCLRERIAYCVFLVSPKTARKSFEQVYGANKA